MINLKLYGKPSSTFAYMQMVVGKTAEKAGLDIEVEEITETQAFIDNQIMSIPAYQLNGKIEERGKKNISEFMRELQISLLKKEDFGTMRKIFVPVDFSNTSDNAVSYAINLSNHFNSVVKLMHAYRPFPTVTEGAYIDPELQEVWQDRLTKMTENLNKKWIGDSDATVIDSEFKVGFAAEQIQLVSQENPEDWIILGSSDSSKSMKNIFGSVSIAVAKEGNCPVFVIPPNATFSPLKRIAFCSSDDTLDANAIEDLLEIAKAFDSVIYIIHVADDKHTYQEVNLRKLLENSYPKDKLEFVTLSGNDHIEVIDNYCEENKIDLLSMVRRKRSIFNKLFHKSFTKQMAITSRIPLLVLHK